MPVATVEEYIDALLPDRKEAVSRLRDVVRANLNPGFEEGIQYGMIGYYVPHVIFPAGYHCDKKQPVPFCHIASQKSHVGFYAFCIYIDPGLKEFIAEYEKTGFKLDMGKGCLRFKKMDQIPFDLIGKLVAKVELEAFLAHYTTTFPKSVK